MQEKITHDIPSYFPMPNERDYKLGKMDRWFCIKNNIIPSIIKEINGEDFEELNNKTEKFSFSLYTWFKIEWIISNVPKEYAIKRNSLQFISHPEIKTIIHSPLQFFKN